jgi:hypothetical protein
MICQPVPKLSRFHETLCFHTDSTAQTCRESSGGHGGPPRATEVCAEMLRSLVSVVVQREQASARRAEAGLDLGTSDFMSKAMDGVGRKKKEEEDKRPDPDDNTPHVRLLSSPLPAA